jgi:hypothetical protein
VIAPCRAAGLVVERSVEKDDRAVRETDLGIVRA